MASFLSRSALLLALSAAVALTIQSGMDAAGGKPQEKSPAKPAKQQAPAKPKSADAVKTPDKASAPAAAGTATPTAKAASGADKDSGENEKLPPVLPSEQFFGPAAMGYAAAKVCPHVCHKMFCYCGCDITDNHSNLLDCFTSMHGADCHICQEEAMIALKMWRNDDSIGSIQKVIDEAFASKYPFKEESPALKKYKSVRKWSPTAGAPTGSGSGSSSDACCGGK